MQTKVTTTDDTLQIYKERNLGSGTIARLPQGAGLQLSSPTVHEGREWMEASLEDSSTGYVLGPAARGHTTLGASLTRPRSPLEEALAGIVTAERNPPPVQGNSPQRDFVVGGLSFVVGIAITAITYSVASKSEGYYIVAWGPMLFGGFRLIRGASRWQW